MMLIDDLKEKYDTLYTMLADEFAQEFKSDYSLSSYSQSLKAFFNFLVDRALLITKIERDNVWDFIQERYSNGNSMDTVKQNVSRVRYVLSRSKYVENKKRIEFLFKKRFIAAAIQDIEENTIDRSFGNYKKHENETHLLPDLERLQFVIKDCHPRKKMSP